MQFPLPLRERARVRGSGVSRLTSELPAPPSSQPSPVKGEGAKTTADQASTILFPLPLWERARVRGRRKPLKHRSCLPSPSSQPSPVKGEGAKTTADQASTILFPLPLRERARVRGSGVSRLNTGVACLHPHPNLLPSRE